MNSIRTTWQFPKQARNSIQYNKRKDNKFDFSLKTKLPQYKQRAMDSTISIGNQYEALGEEDPEEITIFDIESQILTGANIIPIQQRKKNDLKAKKKST